MPRPHPSKNWSLAAIVAGARRRWQLVAIASVVLALVATGAVQYQRHLARVAAEAVDDEDERSWAAEHDGEKSPQSPASQPPRKAREVLATWYDVPDDSLAKRRAGSHEMTAAHNKLPIGTLVHVTHLKNGKSVTVRITDRGIHDRKVKLDLCKEAAEELGMVSKGVARVRMEIVSEGEHGASPPEGYTAAPVR